jgi:thioredoxin reductase (NADPH)
MFTRDELRNIPLFANLSNKDLDYLASTSADIRSSPGDYVICEGDSHRAFFVLVEGRMEGTKSSEGGERIIGTRNPGDTFGEVPVIFDTPSLVNFRAAEPSRVMRLDVKDFRAISASAPQVFASVTATALERVEGLQELAATPSSPMTIVAPRWDEGAHEIRDFLQRNSVDFVSVAPEDWETLTDGRQFPLVRLHDGGVLSAPTIRDIAVAIGLCVFPPARTYDVAIVGGGPAGLAAAVYGASEGLSTVLLEREAPGGQAGTSSRIENYLGFPFGISGEELAHRALQQSTRLGATIVVTRSVDGIDVDKRTLTLDGGDVINAKTILLTTGVSWRQLDIASLERLRGRGVYYGAAPGEAQSVQGQDVYLVGGGNSAGQAAINFSNYANSVTILVRGASLASSMSYYLTQQLNTKPNVRVETHSEVVDAYGADRLEGVVVKNNASGERASKAAAALFILIGADAQTDWLPAAIARDARGYILTGHDALKAGGWPLERYPYILETNVPGIFAAGDVRSDSIKRVAASVGEGSMTIAFVHQYLKYASETNLGERLAQPPKN